MKKQRWTKTDPLEMELVFTERRKIKESTLTTHPVGHDLILINSWNTGKNIKLYIEQRPLRDS